MSVTRYDMDFDDDVLYCYEIQLEESCRGKGLGKFMMKVLRKKEKLYHLSKIVIFLHQVLELLTIQAGLLKTMLTVFKHNTKAVTFFKEVQIQSNKPPQRSTALLMIKFNYRVSNTVWMRLHQWTQFRSNRIRKNP